jgi:hypothetical protein
MVATMSAIFSRQLSVRSGPIWIGVIALVPLFELLIEMRSTATRNYTR